MCVHTDGCPVFLILLNATSPKLQPRVCRKLNIIKETIPHGCKSETFRGRWEENLCINGPVEFKPVLFKGHLC